jgi:outer membrane protein TolC
MPSPLAAALRESDSELAAQGSVIEAKKREVEAIRTRYEQDRIRYIALTDPRGSTPPPR